MDQKNGGSLEAVEQRFGWGWTLIVAHRRRIAFFPNSMKKGIDGHGHHAKVVQYFLFITRSLPVIGLS